MNNYIIDPSLFYWINVFEVTKIVFGILGFLFLVGGGVAIGTYFYNRYAAIYYGRDGVPDKDHLEYVKLSKTATIIAFSMAAVFLILFIFIPGKSTSLEMLVSKTATYENLDWTVEQVKEVINYIVTELQSLK